MPEFLTTKATKWSLRQSKTAAPWIDREDKFSVAFDGRETPPLTPGGVIATCGHDGGLVMKYYCTMDDNKEVAVKQLDTGSDSVVNKKLTDEVTILRKLNHYHSVRIHGSYTHNDWYHIIMKPVAQCDLRNYLLFPNSTKV